uniref:Cysteine-rich and transmembrane domain-containing protein 1 n=1 Tax=Poecilia mexicana TaxID=48701 RepID=A0A3B3WSZ5_9TELE
MNFEQPPPYPGSGPSAPGYPGQGYPPQGYPVNMDQPNPPPFQGYPGQPQYAWQGGPPPGPMYGEDRRRDDTADTCLTACWTALCCCCLWDMLT